MLKLEHSIAPSALIPIQRLKYVPPAVGKKIEGRHVGGFEGDLNTSIFFQKEGHVRKHVANCYWLNVCVSEHLAFIGYKSELFALKKVKFFVTHLTPDQAVKSLRIAWTRWE